MATLRKTSSVVESGILAAIAIVFALIGAYIPVLSLFANFVWPLPLILCGRRNGLKWSILCLLVAAIIVSIIVSPIQALSLIVVFGLIGVVMGECFRRDFSPIKIMLIGSVASLIGILLSFLTGYFLMHIDVIHVFLQSMDQGFQMSLDFYKNIGYTPEQMEEATKAMTLMMEMVKMILPLGFLLLAPFMVFINYWAAQKVLSKLGDNYPWFPDFKEWQFPKWVLFIYGFGLILIMGFANNHAAIGYQIGFNMFIGSSFFMMIQALACIRWYVLNSNKPKWYFSIAVFLIFINSFISQMAVLFGAYDMLFDFRRGKGFGKKK